MTDECISNFFRPMHLHQLHRPGSGPALKKGFLGVECLWRIALLCGQIFVPEAIHNQVAIIIKLLVSGLLTGRICYVYLFLHHNRVYIYILLDLVPCKSFVILTSYSQRRVFCMRQGSPMLILSGSPSTTSHLDINILYVLHYLGSPLGWCT